MADFERLVGRDKALRKREPEIVKELADHLEELYLDLCASGVSQEEAHRRVAGIGAELGSTIRRLRWLRQGGGIAVLRSVVIPGTIGCLLYESVQMAVFNGNTLRANPSVIRPEIWLTLLSVGLAFMVSSLSRALGGNEQRRWVATLFPAWVHFAGWIVMGLLVTPYQVWHQSQAYVDRFLHGIVISLLWTLFWGVLLPAAALATGAAVASRYFPRSAESFWKRHAA
jgi:hypothetical protein